MQLSIFSFRVLTDFGSFFWLQLGAVLRSPNTALFFGCIFSFGMGCLPCRPVVVMDGKFIVLYFFFPVSRRAVNLFLLPRFVSPNEPNVSLKRYLCPPWMTYGFPPPPFSVRAVLGLPFRGPVVTARVICDLKNPISCRITPP